MKYFDAFTGIGGFTKAIQEVYKEKTECVGYSEIDKYACQIYQKHFPNHKNYGNITKISTDTLPDFDLFVGGFPCQAFSIAGKRMGFSDTRGTLFFDIARILRDKKPPLVLLENVKGLLSHDNQRTFETILCTLSELGYSIEWQVLNSKNFGVPQNRERVFIVGHLGGFGGRKVFPLGASSTAHTFSNTIRAGGKGSMTKKHAWDLIELTKDKPDAQRIYDSKGIAKTLKGEGGGQGAKTGLYMVRGGLQKNAAEMKDCSPALTEAMGMGGGHTPIIHNLQTRSANRPSLTRKCDCGSGKLYKKCHGVDGGSGHLQKEDGTTYCLDTAGSQGVELNQKIRRLTPTECERLQGFPDGWTEGVSDTQRYKCLGNAVTVNVVQAIIEKFL